MTERLFSYGTLQDPVVQKMLTGRIIPMQPDTLRGYGQKMVMLGDGVYPILTPDPDGCITGMVLEITPDELQRFDVYETKAYRRVQATLVSGITAWVYIEA